MAKGITYSIHQLATAAFNQENNDNLVESYFFEADGDVDDEFTLIETTGFTTSGDLVHQAKKYDDIVTIPIPGGNSRGEKIIRGTLLDTYNISANADFSKLLDTTINDTSWDPTTGTVTVTPSIAGPFYIIFSHRSNGINNDQATYAPLVHLGGLGAGGITTIDPTDVVGGDPRFAMICQNGTFSNMEVLTQDGAGPGVGQTGTYSLQVSGAVTTMDCVVSGAATSGSDTTHSVTVVDGDLACLVITFSTTAVISGYTGRVLFTPA